MNTTVKTAWIIVLSGVLLFAIAGPLMARPVWVEGTVTKAPWFDDYRHIGIDDVNYTFLPKYVKIQRLFKLPSGAWMHETVDLRSIGVGEKVLFKTEAQMIFDFIVKD